MSTRRAAILLLALSLAAFLFLGVLRGSFNSVRGDEGTYIAMAASLGADRDLRFGEDDRSRLLAAEGDGRQMVILQKTDTGLSYSKPVVYPLLASPFFVLFGETGLIVFNVLVLVVALALAWAFLRRLGPSDDALLTLATFTGAGIVPAYVVWKMSDLLQVALALAGLVLCLAASRGQLPDAPTRLDRLLTHRWAAPIGGSLLGLIVAMRYPNLLVLAAALVALAVGRRFRPAAAVAAGALLGFLVAVALSWTLEGTVNPYRELRSSFNHQTGYPSESEGAEVEKQFQARRATQSLSWRPRIDSVVSTYSAGYFLIGRHTGLLIYLPAALILVGTALRHPDRAGVSLVAGAAALALFYLVWLPRNYYGGATFIGNRYFLAAYPLLLVALSHMPRPRVQAVAWVIAAVAFGSALVSVLETREQSSGSQNHTYAGLFRLLPYESTALRIEGWRDRYWSSDFLRFVDPFIQVGETDFVLRGGDRPGEILLASDRRRGPLLFHVLTNSPGARLEVSDWKGLRSYSVAKEGMVEVATAPAWRRHRFWWDPEVPYYCRVFRLAIRTPDGRPAIARLSYTGAID